MFHSCIVLNIIKKEALSISCVVQSIVEEEDAEEIQDMLNSVSVLNQITPEDMVEEKRDSILGLVCPYITAREKLKSSAIAKIKSKVVQKYLLQFHRLIFKQGVLHQLCINNDVEYRQIILPLQYQAQVLQMLHDGQGHQGRERATALCRECFYWSTMYKDIAEYVKDCPWCQVAKGPYVGPKTEPGSIIANGPLDLLCVDFTTMDPSRDGKKNVLVLTDTFSKFIQAFVTPNKKALTIAKIIVDKWFYIYGIPAWIHSDKGQSFENAILEHLYTMYGAKQSTTMPYNPCGNSTCERFNHMFHDQLKALVKEQKSNCPLNSSSLVFAYNATPHSVTIYQPYELMFGCKAPTVCNSLLWLAKYNDQYLQSKIAWVNEQHELILAVNRWALKASRRQPRKQCTFDIPEDNLVLLRDHPEGRHKIQDN